MSEELFEHTTGQGKEDEDSKQQMEAAQFSENLYDNKIVHKNTSWEPSILQKR